MRLDRLLPEARMDEHGDALFGYALSRRNNPASAEDVVQETFSGGPSRCRSRLRLSTNRRNCS